MDEKSIYISLLKGAVFEPLSINDTVIKSIIDELDASQTIDYDLVYNQIISTYGDLLEPSQEQELLEHIHKLDDKRIRQMLGYIQTLYPIYFIEQLATRRKQIENIYQEISERNILIEDDEITALKKIESTQDFELGKIVFRKIKIQDNKAIIALHDESYAKIENHILGNSGNKLDAEEHWSDCFLEFRTKLRRKPSEKGYYAWRKKGIKTNKEAALITFFIGICKNRWIDKLRKRPDINISFIENYFFDERYDLDYDFDAYDDKLQLLSQLKEAIEKLSKTCQNIIKGKWLDELKSKELSQKIGLSTGYIDNEHVRCIKQLQKLMVKQNL